MKNKFITYMALIAALFVCLSCSTSKNTWLSRNYQTMTTRYNVYFNGEEAFRDGVEKVEVSLVDDYTQVLPLFTYYNHENLKRANSDMDRAVEKMMKAIKKHSIKRKPKVNSSKMRDPKYKEWSRSEEFNPMVVKSYLLMGKATFYKGEFLEAVGIFNYMLRHYPNFPEVNDARMWMARSYAEMDWLYEAENVLNDIADDESFPVWKNGEYSQIKADLLIKQHHYNDAVPYLKTAINAETNKAQRRRLTFSLAQIYQESENYENAMALYNKVLGMSPSYEMSFNARIRLTEVVQGSDDTEGIEKQLRKMLKDQKNEEYRDQIYYALANIELERGNTQAAIENLEMSVKTSTKNKAQQARSLIQLADLYYQQDEFKKAQPYYKQAAGLLDEDFEDYYRITGLAEVLNKLAGNLDTIERNDSLLRVAGMSEAERNKIVEKLIAQAVYKAEHPEDAIGDDVDGSMNLSGASDWYYYNASMVEKGKRDFQRSWGNRPLEDNWRRSVKTTMFASNDNADLFGEGEQAEEKKIPEDQTAEYYTKNIPLTAEAKDQTQQGLCEAYLGAANIYKDNLKSYDDAEENYNLMLQTCPDGDEVINAKFGLYSVYLNTDRAADAERIKQEIIAQYPHSNFAVMLSNPNYFEELQATKAIRDSLYTDTYEAYMRGDYPKMFANVNRAYTEYPNSELQPNFMYMEALAIAKTEMPQKFQDKLMEIKEDYPNSDVVPHVNSLIGLMNEGLLPSRGGTGGPMGVGVDTSKVEPTEEVAVATATDEKPVYELDYDRKHYFVIIHPEQEIDKVDLTFKLSSFNFKRFLVKDFDISFVKLNRWYNLLVIDGFNGAEEAFWYRKTILEDGVLAKLINSPGVKQFVISDVNFRTMANLKNPDAYEAFYLENYKRLEEAAENPYEEAQ